MAYTLSYNPYGNIQTYRKIYKELEYEAPKVYLGLSRYQETLRIFDQSNDVYYQETVDRKTIPESNTDVFITVTKSSENRLDIIANMVYSYSLYWWVIAMANDIDDPFNVPIGTVLRCPPLASLYGSNSVFS